VCVYVCWGGGVRRGVCERECVCVYGLRRDEQCVCCECVIVYEKIINFLIEM
jgi:hypothetical protein